MAIRHLLAIPLAAAGMLGCAPAPAEPVRVVAVTASTTAQPQPTLGDAGTRAVRAAVDSDRGAFTLLVAGEPDLTREVDLVVRRPATGEPEYGPARVGMVDAKLAEVAAVVAGVAADGGEPDLLDTLALAADGPPGTLVVADSGVSTTDPLDLTAMDWAADPAAVVEDLRRQERLPDLRGWFVVFVGLGRVADPQPPLEEPQRRWLESLWTAICTAARARSCTVDPGDPRAVPALSTRSVPPVAIPAATTVRHSRATEITLPDARLGFSAGSAELRGDPGAALAPVLEAVAEAGPGHRVRVAGFVAHWGDDGYRATLSQARADAVAAWLVAHGLPRGSVVAEGRGAADGPEASRTDGEFDEQKVSRNGVRRVVVTIEPAA